MKRSELPDLISFLLILMFCYAAVSKLIVFDLFKQQMKLQPIPHWSIASMVYAVPISELTIVILLISKRFRMWGFYLSTLLMTIFTIYVGLALVGAYGKTPCTCGGIIQELGWPGHFVFNLLFLALSIYGIWTDQKERRFIGK